MDFEMQARFANIETRLMALETSFGEAQVQRDAIQAALALNTAATTSVKSDTAEIVELFRDAKVGAKFIKTALAFAKGCGGLALAVATIWGLIYAAKYGGPPPISHG